MRRTITDVWTMRFVQHPRNSVENLHRARVWRNSWFRMSSGIRIRKKNLISLSLSLSLSHMLSLIISKKRKEIIIFFFTVSFRVVFAKITSLPPRGEGEIFLLPLNHWVFNNFMYSALFKFSTEFLGYWMNRIIHISWWHLKYFL